MTAAAPRSAPLYGGFFLVGIVAVMLGPLIPGLEEEWGGGHSAAASLFLAQFAASSAGAVVSSFRPRLSLILGYALISAGLLSLAGGLSWGDGGFFGWPLARIAMVLVGLGLGLTITATNLTVSHRNPRRRGASLAVVNLVWGIGAAGCPLLFAALLGRYSAALALWFFSALAALACVALWVTLENHPLGKPREEPSAEPAGPHLQNLAPLLMLAAMLFLYVGSENAVGGWVVALSDQLGQERAAVSMLIHSGFWGAILGGRATAAVMLRRVGEPAVYKASLALACVGTLTILLADSRTGIAVGTVLAGFGCAPLFPLTVSILTAQTAATGSRNTGWVFACGGVGGAVLPWLTGQVGGASDLSSGFVVPLAGLVLLAVLFGLHRVLYSG